MYNLSNADINLIIRYHDDIDGLIDVVKVICNDAYNNGNEDGYDTGYYQGYNDGMMDGKEKYEG